MASLSGWTEAGIGIILVMLCLGVIVGSLNHDYGKSYDSGFNIDTGSVKNDFEDYQGTLQTGMEGEAETNAVSGVNVVSSWSVIRSGLSMVFNMITGGWIINAVGLLQLGKAGIYLGWALRILFIFSVGFIFIKILFKVKP